jgi:hypothetical protein
LLIGVNGQGPNGEKGKGQNPQKMESPEDFSQTGKDFNHNTNK